MQNRSIIVLAAILAIVACQNDPGADPFLWLEEIEGERALTWVREQNERSLDVLTRDPRFETLHQEALAILTSKERIPEGDIHAKSVDNFWQDDQHVRGIWRRATLDSFRTGNPQWQVLLDVDALAVTEGENWVFKGVNCFGPAYDRCLVSLSRGGTDASIYREFSVSRRGFVEDGFLIPEAKGRVDWVSEDMLLVGTDWGEGTLTESGYPRIVKAWKRGTPLEQAEVVYSGIVTDVGVSPNVYRDDGTTYAFITRAVTFYEAEHIQWDQNGNRRQLPLPLKSNLIGVLAERAIATLEEDWTYRGHLYPQGSLVALKLDDLTAELIYAPRAIEAIQEVEIGTSKLFVSLLENVAGTLKIMERGARGWHGKELALPDQGVSSIVSANPKGDDLLVSFESLTIPDSLYYISEQGHPEEIMSLPAFYEASDVVVEQRFATSADGTKVPYFIAGKRDVLQQGNAPTIQYGYGGFLSAVLPHYYEDPARPQHGALAGKLWISRGGVLVLSNIRGGGEFGPAWHEAALKYNRHRAYEDFFAIAEHLISTGATTADKLGAIGRSNGGLLMGVALVQRPDLYAAIDIGVPLADMLRYDKLLAGASWTGEYGDPDIPEDREYILTYSPYQNLEKDADYPEVFFYTSAKDDRVHPGHARKMAARMQAFGHPLLYYENIEGGHGGTANQEQLAFRTALEYMYFFQKLSGARLSTSENQF